LGVTSAVTQKDISCAANHRADCVVFIQIFYLLAFYSPVRHAHKDILCWRSGRAGEEKIVSPEIEQPNIILEEKQQRLEDQPAAPAIDSFRPCWLDRLVDPGQQKKERSYATTKRSPNAPKFIARRR
jgi:hypothetical protein